MASSQTPNAPAKPSVRGQFDRLRDNHAWGWAFDPARPQERLTVEIVCDGRVVASGTADRFRPDLLKAGLGDGHCSFNLPLPPTLFDGRDHALVARVAGTDKNLGGSHVLNVPKPVNVKGNFEGVRDHQARGWAFDPDCPRERVSVEIVCNGQVVASGRADQFRDDLLKAELGDGCCSFSLFISPKLFDGRKHNLTARVAGTDKNLAGGPHEFHVPRPLAVKGHFDGVNDGHAVGWAFDPGRPGERLSVQIFRDRQVVASGTADQFRADLLKAGFGDGHCSFRLPLPPDLLDGREHTLAALLTGTETNLAGSPRKFSGSAATGQGAGRPVVAAKEQPANMVAFQTKLPPASMPKKERTALIENLDLRHLILYPSQPLAPPSNIYNPKSLDLHWVIPSFSPGGGGLRAIFIMTRWLEIFGHNCTIWVKHVKSEQLSTNWTSDVINNYPLVQAKVLPLNDHFFKVQADAVLATGWQTVAVVCHATGFKERFYYVQDYESMFSPQGALSLSAEMTYHRDIACICASPWLAEIMKKKYGRWVRYFYSSHDPLIYKLKEPEVFLSDKNSHTKIRSSPRIAFYSRITSPRRVVELGLLALEILNKKGVHFHVDFFGNHNPFCNVPYDYTDHGVLNFEQLAELYQKSDIGICFSSSNYGGVPKEMMACGLPILELDVESTRAVYPGNVVTFCLPDPVIIAEKIESLLNDPDKRNRQARQAYTWAMQFSWEKSTRIVESAIIERLSEKGFSQSLETSPLKAFNSLSCPKVSVLIPTFNGGKLFKEVLKEVQKQRTPWRFEIVIIDSGSTDGTVEFCIETPDVRVLQIPQSEFSHGRTRNRGIEICKGEYVALLTQDAMPANEFWLYNIVTTLEHFPDAAGAFGRHLAYPEASPFIKRDIARQFERYDREHPIAVGQDTNKEKWEAQDTRWLQMLHFYSDNNSCLRKSVWEKIPYPNVGYGEDQLWALEVIKNGYKKVYAKTSIVYHSHNYSPDEAKERGRVAAAWRMKYFGYKSVTDTHMLNKRLENLCKQEQKWAKENKIGNTEIEKQMEYIKSRLHGELEGYLAFVQKEKWIEPL